MPALKRFTVRLNSTVAVVYCVAMLSSTAVFPLSAEEYIKIQVVADWTPAENSRPDVLLSAAQKELTGGVFDPRADTLLKAAEGFTKDVFNLPPLTFVRASTYQNDNSDEMLVEWNFKGPASGGMLVLRDTPFLSEYTMLFHGCSCRTSEDLSRLLTTLVVWVKRPVNIGTVEIKLPASYPNSPAFVGAPPPLFSEVAVIRDFILLGWVKDQDLYLQINVGKAFTESYYPVPPFIPERFPPLTELVQSWGTRRIWVELGRPAGPSKDIDLSEIRDKSLLAELARRGLSENEFVELLRNVRRPYQLYARARDVIQSMHNAGKAMDFNRYFEAALTMYQGLGPSAGNAVVELFGERFRRSGCAEQLEADALRLLRENVFHRAAIVYLGECSTSEAAVRAIMAASVPDGLVAERDMVLRDIKRRLGKEQVR
jgi:hypothetical protein